MVISTNIIEENSKIEENKKNILAINNFENIKTNNRESDRERELEGSLTEILNNESVANTGNTTVSNKENQSIAVKDEINIDEEIIGEDDIGGLQSEDSGKLNLLEGGARKKNMVDTKDAFKTVKTVDDNDSTIDTIDNTVYNIDYILEEDEKLINPENVFNNVDIYIENYNSNEIIKYKKNLKQLYQTYSTKNYIISTIKYKSTSKIIVKKNDKVPKIVKELIKPTYLFYDEDNKLIKFKRQISNDRSELLYKYSQLIAKLNIKSEEKKEFEKERSKFIEKLEEYYTYTLYHKKINKITTINKSNLVLQKELIVYNENNDYDNKILNSNIYSIDNNVIDTINKYNSENLIQYNNIMMDLSGKKDKKINKEKEKDKEKDKKTLDSIKLYLKQRQEIESFTKSLSNNTDIQDEYINYIILELP